MTDVPPGFPKFREPAPARKSRPGRARRDRDAVKQLRAVCQLCNQRPSVHAHHVKSRAQGGTDDPENLRALCELCHDLIERNRHWARATGWLA